MLTKEEIIKLKKIDKAFMFLDTETQDKLKGLLECLEWLSYLGNWNSNGGDEISLGTTYRLRQDYPENNFRNNWDYCPECGGLEFLSGINGERECIECKQSWFIDVDYTEVIRKHINSWYASKLISKNPEPITEEEKKYLWVCKDKYRYQALDNYRTKDEMIKLCRQYNCTHYAKLVDCQRPDGSLNEDVFMEVKE